VTAAATITYAISKKMSLTGRAAKDFSATASDVSLDTLNASLDLQYAFSAKLAFSVDTGYGKNRFLGPGAISPEPLSAWKTQASIGRWCRSTE